MVGFDGCAKSMEVEIVVAGSNQWCWLGFFRSQVVGRSGFLGLDRLGSLVVLVGLSRL